MPYVYRYTDLDDNTVKYIGIIKNDTHFPGRFDDHKRDKLAGRNWKIEYIYVSTITDAEALEYHFIAFYQTYNWFNVAKRNGGLCTFAPSVYEFEWEEYECLDRDGSIFSKFRQLSGEIDATRSKCERLYEKLCMLRQESKEMQRQGMLRWINARLYFSHSPLSEKNYISFEMAFMDYNEFADLEEYFIFENFSDFSYELQKRNRLKDLIVEVDGKSYITGVCFIGSENHEEMRQKDELYLKEAMLGQTINKMEMNNGKTNK